MEGNAAPGRGRLALTASSSQIDFPAFAPPSAGTALSSCAAEAGSVLVRDCFLWCFLLARLPAYFFLTLEFIQGYGSPDCPTGLHLSWQGNQRLLGAAAASGYQHFQGRLSWQPAALFLLLHFQLSAPNAISTLASTKPEPGWTKIKPVRILLL